MLRSRDSQRKQAAQRRSPGKSIPAPVGGLNSRDSIANMKSQYAVVMENWFPRSSDVVIRKGYAEHATGLGAQVETIMPYRPENGTNELFAVAGGSIFDVTAAGAVGAAEVSSLSNSRWQYVNFATAGGNYLICVNGQDDLLLYDGTTWTPIDGVSSPAITGVATSSLKDLNVHKQRIWYIENASKSAWYTAAGAFAGALIEFSLDAVFQDGGFLVSMDTWSLDSGDGLDDLALFTSSTGEVAVYQGTDPGSPITWALVGVYRLGAPIGQRCMTKFGAELLGITLDGVVPMSSALYAGQTQETAITDIIRGDIERATELYSANFGWELRHYPDANMLLLNVPVAPDFQIQYAMNTRTKSWCKFTGWGANCFELHNDDLYFGGNDTVNLAWTGQQDNGMAITADVCSAFSYYGSRAELKDFKMFRPIIARSTNPVEVKIAMNTDLFVEAPTAIVSFPEVDAGSTWNTAIWNTDVWGGGNASNQFSRWFDAQGIGLSGAPHMIISTDRAEIALAAFDIIWENGGLL